MAARAIWKGVIRCDDFRLPIKVYSAVEDRGIHFHLLHDQDMVRVRQRMANSETDVTVPSDQVRKGFEVKSGEYVTFDPDELAELEPEASRDIPITHFVPVEKINHQWYDHPYWLGPDGDEAAYFALAAALAAQNVEGVCKWAMRKKQYVGALRSDRGYLSLVTMRHVEEVIPSSALNPPQGRKPDPRERDMAGQLITALEAQFDPDQFHDEYRDRVRELIAAKAEGKTVEVREVEDKPQESSLADSLAASLHALKG